MKSGMHVHTLRNAEVGEWERLLKQDEAAALDARFTLLVERQSRFVFRVAFALLRNFADAEDVVQRPS
jgi:RNA polymerase sigma-70 factor, ECF subfamily